MSHESWTPGRTYGPDGVVAVVLGWGIGPDGESPLALSRAPLLVAQWRQTKETP